VTAEPSRVQISGGLGSVTRPSPRYEGEIEQSVRAARKSPDPQAL
jgi:hypothetical protein